MKLKWNGHACFTVTSDSGVIIIIDPYEPGGFAGALRYAPVPDKADLVLITHEHSDHNFVKGLKGSPKLVRESGELRGIKIKALPAFHDDRQGAERGKNLLFSFLVDGIRVAHLGDLGHMLDQQQVDQLEHPDVLLIPVGGTFTIDADHAFRLTNMIKPKIAVPMHFKTEKVDFPIKPAEKFSELFTKVKKLEQSEVEISKSGLPQTTEVWVLKYAC